MKSTYHFGLPSFMETISLKPMISQPAPLNPNLRPEPASATAAEARRLSPVGAPWLVVFYGDWTDIKWKPNLLNQIIVLYNFMVFDVVFNEIYWDLQWWVLDQNI